MIAQGKIESYDCRGIVVNMPPEEYAELRATVKEIDWPEDQAKAKDLWATWEGLVDDGDVARFTRFGLHVKISRVRGVASERRPDHNNISQHFHQIAVANVGLMEVQRVMVLEDCCTDELQKRLDQGFRILAVCPPNDTRRPSYVIGHKDKNA